MVGLLLLLISIVLFNLKKYYFSLILFFLLITNGFQIIPVNWLMSGAPLQKASDLALIYILVIGVIKLRKIGLILKSHNIYKWCLYLFAFCTITALYSYFALDYPVTNIFQVYRQYLVFIGFVVFFVIPLPVLTKVFHTLAFITLIQSFLFLLQIVVGDAILLSPDGNEFLRREAIEGYSRFYNSPSLQVPVLFYFLFVYKFKKSLYFYLSVTLLLLTIIAPLHRSGIMAIVAVLLVYTFLKKGGSIYLVGLSILTLLFSFIDVVNNRMYTAYLDITSTFSNKLNLNTIDAFDNNLIYRIGHLLERYEYVMSVPLGWLFGIGMISDNSPLASRLPFVIGLKSEVTGQIVQIDTGDLVYSLLILNLGIVGMILYLIVFIKFLIFFYKNLKYSNFAIIGFLTILNGFFISMAGTEMLSFTFRTIILFMSVIVCKEVILKKNI